MNAHFPDTPLKPPLKWAGGKRWLVPHLRPYWDAYRARHPHGRYVEPFVGGLALPLALQPPRALLNDSNPHLINFYQWLQAGASVDIDMRYDRALYDAHRTAFNAAARDGRIDDYTAQLFYYLNRTGYNGLCRFNLKGEFNVPFGQYKRVAYATSFAAYAPILRAWTFTQGDFESIQLDDDDFVYADPPYDVEFTKYARQPFTFADQRRLVAWLAGQRGIVILSNQATDRMCALYADAGYALHFFDAPRRISNNGDRRSAREVLAVKGITLESP
jgi:DNA adenine methylase